MSVDRTDAVDPTEETPEADAMEQQIEVRPHEEEPVTHLDTDSASEGDAAEQAREVILDDEDEEEELP